MRRLYDVRLEGICALSNKTVLHIMLQVESMTVWARCCQNTFSRQILLILHYSYFNASRVMSAMYQSDSDFVCLTVMSAMCLIVMSAMCLSDSDFVGLTMMSALYLVVMSALCQSDSDLEIHETQQQCPQFQHSFTLTDITTNNVVSSMLICISLCRIVHENTHIMLIAWL